VAWHGIGWEPDWFSEVEAFSKAVLTHHYPGVKDLGDMNLIEDGIRDGSVEAPDILVGGTPCFIAGTLVLCQRGLIPIEEVLVGDEVWTHKCRWRRVTKLMSRTSDTIILKGQGHPGLETTTEHPFYALEKHSRTTHVKNCSTRITGTTEPKWCDAKDMAGRFWATPASYPTSNIPPFETKAYECRNQPKAFDKNFFWLIGAWLRSNQISGRHEGQTNEHVLFCGNKKDKEILSKKIGLTGLSFSVSEQRTTVRFQIVSKPLSRWILANFGQHCDKSKIPFWMMGLENELKQAFLDGYMFADGGYYKQLKGGYLYRATTVSRELSVTLRMLYATIGKSCTVCFCKLPHKHVTEGQTVNQRSFFQISAYDISRSAFVKDNFLWGKVRNVLPGRENVQVHNLEVDEDNSYTADGIVVHNCQSFSVAGARRSLDDQRGVLALTYVRIANAIDDVRSVRGLPGVVTLWENVPGVLNTKDNAFGCLLGALAGEDVPLEPPGGRWKDAGYVLGPKRAVAFRCFDAQHFGLAQRRKRVFVISGPRDWFRPEEVLFEWESCGGYTPKSRESWQTTASAAKGSVAAGSPEFDVTGTLCSRGSGGGLGTDLDCARGIVVDMKPEPCNDVAATLTSKFCGASNQWAPHNEADNLIPVRSVLPFDTTQITSDKNYSHPKSGDPCHPIAASAHPPAAVISIQDVREIEKHQNGCGWNDEGISYTVDSVATQGVAYSFGCDLSQKAEGIGFKKEQAPCIAPGTHPGFGSHAVIPMAFKTSHYTRGKDGAPSEVCPPLTREADKGDQDPIVMASSQERFCVRRLTPDECEILMGFPKGYTKIPFRGKPAEECPDGPRYKALGNSFAVPVVAWIGKRIDSFIKTEKGNGNERKNV